MRRLMITDLKVLKNLAGLLFQKNFQNDNSGIKREGAIDDSILSSVIFFLKK